MKKNIVAVLATPNEKSIQIKVWEEGIGESWEDVDLSKLLQYCITNNLSKKINDSSYIYSCYTIPKDAYIYIMLINNEIPDKLLRILKIDFLTFKKQ